MSGRAVFFVSAALAAATLSSRAAAARRTSERGERIMNASCQELPYAAHDSGAGDGRRRLGEKCGHDGREGREGVEGGYYPALDYLVQHHGPLPEGAGKQVVLNICTMCHDLSRIKQGRRSSEEWEETLVSMLNEGAPLSDEDFARRSSIPVEELRDWIDAEAEASALRNDRRLLVALRNSVERGL